jgi:hypothetical protein
LHVRLQQEAELHLALGALQKANTIDKLECNTPTWVRGEYDLKGSNAQRLRIGFAKCGEIYALSIRTLQSNFGTHRERMWRHRSGCRARFAD